MCGLGWAVVRGAITPLGPPGCALGFPQSTSTLDADQASSGVKQDKVTVPRAPPEALAA